MRSTIRRDAAWAVVALAGGTALLAVGAYTRWSGDWPSWAWSRAVPVVVACAAVSLRRTAPMLGLAVGTAAFLGDAVLGPSLGVPLIYTDNLYAAVLYGPRRATRWLLGATIAATVALTVVAGLAGAGPRALVQVAAIAGMVLVGPVLTALSVQQYRDRAEAQRRNAAQVTRLAEMDRLAAVAAERARMARELHDVVANHLSAVALHSSAVISLHDMDPETVRDELTVIRDNSVRGLAEMRHMIGLLRDGDDGAEPTPAPRLDEVERLAERTARFDLSTGVTVTGSRRELPDAVEMAAYRIAQESLTNALKHAGPGRAGLLVDYGPHRLVIAVDSPLGGDSSPVPGAGRGLIGMSERASLLGGAFRAGPEEGRWRVCAELPTTAGEGSSS